VKADRTSSRRWREAGYQCETLPPSALLALRHPLLYTRSQAVREDHRGPRPAARCQRGVGWHRAHQARRYDVEGNVDWLSRDRYWGTPLPIWECDAAGCNERFCAGSIADLRERAAEVPEDLHRPYIDEISWGCEREGCDGTMRRVASVIDAWFDSGSMPWAQFHYPFENEELFAERFPADFICEAIDQTRGWFYTLLAEAVLLFDTSSYRNVVCLGLILDPEGQKMSKSRGNVVEPWDVINRHGADAFRWYYFASQQPWAGYRFSVDTVGEAVRHFLLTLWNTYAFWVTYANASGLETGELPYEPRWTSGDQSEPTELDRWAVSRLQRTIAEVREQMEGFDCTTAARAIADYTEELSNWYVRLNRRRFWDGDLAALETLRFCLGETAKLLAPFTPFIADEIYANLLFGDETGLSAPVDKWTNEEPDSIHLCDYPVVEESLIDAQLEAGMEAVRRTIELGRAARAQAKVKLRQPLRKAIVVASDAEREAIERLADVVASELNVKELDFVRSEAELVSYGVKPNYRSLGPRFGKNMPQVAAAVEALDAGGVAEQLEAGADVGIAIDGKEHTLTADDINLVMEPLEGYQLEAEAGHAVALELDLDDELRREGLAREVVRAVQEARKQAGLEVSDRISLELGGDDELIDSAREHESYIAGETLATSVDYGADGAGEKATIEGRELRIALSKA
jgi:isoleucyl-tRNA synthetase